MKRILPVAIVAVLIVAGVVLSLSVGADSEAQVQRPAATRYPEVWEALQTAHEVDVFVALREAPNPLQQTTEERKAYTAPLQDAVLSVLTSDDFTLRTRFLLSPALSGLITRTGLLKLEDHPDVVGIDLLGGGELH